MTLSGHENLVTAVACGLIPSSGPCIVSGSWDYTVRIWDANTGDVTAVMKGHTAAVLCIALSSDGGHIASGGDDDTVRLWDTNTKTVVAIFEGHRSGIYAVAFSPDTTRIASGSIDHTVRLWDVLSRSEVAPVLAPEDSGVSALVFSPDGSRLAIGTNSGSVAVQDVKTGERVINALTMHMGTVSSLVFTVSGTCVLSGSWDSSVRMWSATTGECVAVFRGSSIVHSIALSLHESRVFAGTISGSVAVWDAALGKDHGTTYDGHSSRINAVAFSRDGAQVASASSDNTVRIWSTQTGCCIAILSHEDSVHCVEFSPDGSSLASWEHHGEVRVWSTSNYECTVKLHTSDASLRSAQSLAFSPDNSQLAIGYEHCDVEVWDVATCQRLMSLESGYAKCLSFSPDARLIAAGLRWPRGVRISDTRTGKAIAIFHAEEDVRKIWFSSDGSRVHAIGRCGTVMSYGAQPQEGRSDTENATWHTIELEQPGDAPPRLYWRVDDRGVSDDWPYYARGAVRKRVFRLPPQFNTSHTNGTYDWFDGLVALGGIDGSLLIMDLTDTIGSS